MIEKLKAEIKKVDEKIKKIQENPYYRNLSGGFVSQAAEKLQYLKGLSNGLKKALEILIEEKRK